MIASALPAKEIATALAREENRDGIGPRRKTTHGKSLLLRQIVLAKEKEKPEIGSEEASSEAVVTRLASALAGEEKRQHGV